MPVNNWNEPQNPQPPVNAWNSPQPYAQSPVNPEITRLESDSQLWLIVAVAGFFVGTMIITGPLSWYQGNKLCERYRALGAAPSQNANAARIIGMITTIFSALLMLVGVAMVMAFVVFAAANHR